MPDRVGRDAGTASGWEQGSGEREQDLGVGSARAAKAAKAKASFLASVLKSGEVGYRKQDCTKVAVFRMHRRITSSLVWDIGNVDVDGGWQVKMKKVSPTWCPLGLTRTAFCPGQGNQVAAARPPKMAAGFRHSGRGRIP